MVRKVHSDCKHLGVPTTLNSIHTAGYWIIQGRSFVKSVIGSCIICKKLKAFPFKYPKPSDYVLERVNFKRPFQYTGVDYTSHVYVRQGEGVKKMYIVIFTCMSVRGIQYTSN